MTRGSEPGFVAETLEWCNRVRAEKDLDPLDRLPKGDREDPQSCPCGKATGLWVDHETYGTSQATFTSRRLPDPVIEFVAAFDGGDLPQYEENPACEDEDEEW